MGRLASRPASNASMPKMEDANLNRAHISAYTVAWAHETAVNLKFAIRWIDTEHLTEALISNFTYDQLCTLASKSVCSNFAKSLASAPGSESHDQAWLIDALKNT